MVTITYKIWRRLFEYINNETKIKIKLSIQTVKNII
jgi:hypothetical protein